MRFARPEILWLLLLVPAAGVWLGVSLAGRRRALLQFTGEPLLARLVRTASFEKMVVKTILLIVASIFLILAAARPQWGSSMQQVARQGVDVLIGIDISESMLAEDIRPSRLQKALAAASGLLDRFAGDRVGLMAFAGSAGVVCPLTLDYNAVRMFLDTLTPDMISYPGTSLTYAIRVGSQAFGAEERKFKVMILFTDGEDQVDAEETARAAQEAAGTGLVIHTIGMGTPAGAPIPVRGKDGAISGYKKDKDGRVVTSRLEETLLTRISQMTAGIYLPATAAENELDRIAGEIAGMDKKELQARLMTQYEERYQVPLALGLAALAVEVLLSNRKREKLPAKPRRNGGRMRQTGSARSAATTILLGVVVWGLCVTPVRAASAPSLVTEGNRLYREGKLAEALEKYRAAQAADPQAAAPLHYNIGNVLYRQGEFEKAKEEYRQAFSARERDLAQGARFNAGNADYSNRNWPDAIRNYQEALRLDPTDRDAKKNLELALLQMQEEQKKKQQQREDQERPDQNEDKQQKKKQQEQQKQDQPQNANDKQQDQATPPPNDREPNQGNEKDRLSREEAMRILDAMRRQDKPPTDQLKVPKPDQRPERDW